MDHHSWLLEAARAAGLANADRLPESLPTSLIEAWETISRVTGADPGTVAEGVAAHLRLRVADLDERDASVLRLIPEKVARQYSVLPLQG